MTSYKAAGADPDILTRSIIDIHKIGFVPGILHDKGDRGRFYTHPSLKHKAAVLTQ